MLILIPLSFIILRIFRTLGIFYLPFDFILFLLDGHERFIFLFFLFIFVFFLSLTLFCFISAFHLHLRHAEAVFAASVITVACFIIFIIILAFLLPLPLMLIFYLLYFRPFPFTSFETCVIPIPRSYFSITFFVCFQSYILYLRFIFPARSSFHSFVCFSINGSISHLRDILRFCIFISCSLICVPLLFYFNHHFTISSHLLSLCISHNIFPPKDVLACTINWSSHPPFAEFLCHAPSQPNEHGTTIYREGLASWLALQGSLPLLLVYSFLSPLTPFLSPPPPFICPGPLSVFCLVC